MMNADEIIWSELDKIGWSVDRMKTICETNVDFSCSAILYVVPQGEGAVSIIGMPEGYPTRGVVLRRSGVVLVVSEEAFEFLIHPPDDEG